jgi:hypothetical protein
MALIGENESEERYSNENGSENVAKAYGGGWRAALMAINGGVISAASAASSLHGGAGSAVEMASLKSKGVTTTRNKRVKQLKKKTRRIEMAAGESGVMASMA